MGRSIRAGLVLVMLPLGVLVGPRTVLADDSECIASSERGLALRQQGKFHDALKQLAVCADAACPDEVKTECAHRIAAIGEAMPTLILVAKDGAGNDLPAVRVAIDGGPLGAVLDGRPLALDPGPHTFRFEVDGQPPTEKTLLLRQSDKDRRETILLGPAPAPAPPPPTQPPARAWNTPKTLAVTAGGIGVAGVALGATFGLLASSARSREQSECSLAGCTNRPAASADYDSATRDATVSTIAFGLGAAFLVAGALLWFTAPRSASGAQAPKGPTLLGRRGLTLGGDW